MYYVAHLNLGFFNVKSEISALRRNGKSEPINESIYVLIFFTTQLRQVVLDVNDVLPISYSKLLYLNCSRLLGYTVHKSICFVLISGLYFLFSGHQ